MQEVLALFQAVDNNATSCFGIVKLSTLTLDSFYQAPDVKWIAMPPALTLIEYAIRRKRDMVAVRAAVRLFAESYYLHSNFTDPYF